MFKIILLAVVATALAKENRLYSIHAPGFMKGSLGLTTGELKQFSGHALNIIQAKCPSVDAQKIFQVQKYIGKLIAKNEPVQGKSETFKSLLETMTTCAKEGAIPKPELESDRPSIFTSLFHPMRNIKTLWFNRPEPMPLFNEDDEIPSNVDSGLLEPIPSISPQEQFPEAVPVQNVPMDAPTGTGEEIPTHRIIKTTILVNPQQMQEGIRSSGGFFNWIHNMFSRVSSFFGNMFPFGQLRKKRDVSDVQPIMDLQDASPTFSVWTPKKDDSKGKKAFGGLIDEMCRLYCDTCTGHKEIMNFKLAAKELLTYLFNEDSGLELAAKKYIDEEFLQTIHDCE